MLNYELSWSQNVTPNNLFSNLIIFKFCAKKVNYIPRMLYIPIWLYSNYQVAGLGEWGIVDFTFQSGYIQIFMNSSTASLYLAFTFQSGYIQI